MEESAVVQDDGMMHGVEQRRIFVGNPGAGKSTLLNALLGRVEFRSGTSIATGLTAHLQWAKDDTGIKYGDTPGLADVRKREAAAEEISSALRAGGVYQLVFVLTLESGRVKPDDIATIQLVLAAIQKDDFQYAVIVNKVTENFLTSLGADEANLQKLMTTLNSHSCTSTPFVFLYPKIAVLEDADDKWHAPSDELKEFLSILRWEHLTPMDVKDVQSSVFEEEKERLSQTIETLRSDQALMEQKWKVRMFDRMSEMEFFEFG